MGQRNKNAEIRVRSEELMEREIHKPFGYQPFYWLKWGAVARIIERIQVPIGSKVLDLGCGAGWTSYMYAKSGYKVTGLDIVPLNIATAKRRFKQEGLKGAFNVGDIENFKLKTGFDLIMIFDALHHTDKQLKVIENCYKHLRPGGWLIIGEPSLLHKFSKEARRVIREEGILERGITIRSMRRDLKTVGFTGTFRLYEGTQPYFGKFKGFLWQLSRLIAGNFFFAPQASNWIVAQRPKE